MIDLFHSLGQIFMQLFNVSMTAGWFVLAVVLIRLLLKKAPKWISCVLWGMVAIRLVMPFSIESALSLVPSVEPLPVTNIYKSGPDISGNLIYRNVNSGSQIFDAVVGTAMRETNSVSVLKDNFSLLACIWILGMLAMLIYTVVSCFKISKKLNEAMPLRDNVWLCDRIDSPFIFGLVKPRIFLPSNMNEADMDFVIAHENAHLKRRDHWWKPLGFMLLTVYWFNPVLWIAYILLCKDIELACDEKVIKEMGAEIKKDYSNALINCSVPRKSIAACPLAFGETGVKGRIKSVLNYKKPAFWVIVVAVIASIVLAVCFLTNPIDNSSIFNAKYETGECLFDDVVTEDKQTNKNELSFGINSTGGVYKDYGNGEGEYIGELKDSVFSTNELNSMIEEQGGKRIDIGRAQKVYEISDDNGKKDYVFFHKKNGDVSVVMFFSDGGIMSVFNLVKKTPTDTEHNNSLDDELSVFIDGRIAEHFQNEKSVNHACCVDYEVLGKRKFFGETTLYLWVMYQEYSFDGVLKEECGAHIPTAITVRKENGGYKLVEYWEPRDGSYYARDIKDKFPFYLHNKGIDSQRYVKQQIARCEALAMEHFGIDYAQYGGIDGYNAVAKNRPLTLSDVITLSEKKDKLTWSDFEEFRYIETGSGLYIRQYDIDEMFTLLIGGGGPDEEPMYIYLHASDAWDFQIDIRQSDVEAFINEHQKNPVVKNLSASWHCIPVGYNEKTYSKMIEIGGISPNAYMNKIQYMPVVKIEDVNELQSFMQKMNAFMSFDKSYSDAPSFNEVKAEYNEEFFNTSSLLLAYTSSPTTAHRYTVDNITKSEGIITVNIAEIDPEGGDTAMEGWLVAVRVSKEDIADAEKIDALISSVQYPNRGTANATLIRTCVFEDSKGIIKPSISLYDNGMFQFTFSAYSSYIGVGSYTIENNRMILNTEDGKFTYVFDMVEKDDDDPKYSTAHGEMKFVFDAEHSSEMLWMSDIYDGCEFM